MSIPKTYAAHVARELLRTPRPRCCACCPADEYAMKSMERIGVGGYWAHDRRWRVVLGSHASVRATFWTLRVQAVQVFCRFAGQPWFSMYLHEHDQPGCPLRPDMDEAAAKVFVGQFNTIFVEINKDKMTQDDQVALNAALVDLHLLSDGSDMVNW